MENEAMKAELLKLGLHNDKNEDPKTLVNRTPMLKTWFPNVENLVSHSLEAPGDIFYSDPRLLDTDYAQDMTLGSTPSIIMSPTPPLKKVGKKKKSQTVTKPKPKSQGPEASGVPPKVTKGKKHVKTKKTSLIQSTLKFTHEKEPSEATNTSQSMPSGQNGTRKSKLLPEGKTTDPKDSEGNIQLADMGLLSTSNKGIHNLKPLPEGKPADAKYP
ncbi:hypothetical protein Tco_0487285 [Tanacetum coccineum]